MTFSINHFKAILFDLDGTLIDSNDACTISWIYGLRGSKFEISYPKMRSLIGMGGDQIFKVLKIPPSRQKKISKIQTEILNLLWKSLHPFAGAGELINQINRSGRLTSIVSSGHRKNAVMGQKLMKAKVKIVVSSDDVSKSKPDPDLFIQFLKLTPFKPEDCLMVGDTPYDIRAAKKAKIASIGFTCGGWTAAKLKEAGAIKVFSGPEEFLNFVIKSLLK